MDLRLKPNCCVCFAEGAKKCSGCMLAYYCSKECQSADWKEHKGYCIKITESTSEVDTKQQLEIRKIKKMSSLRISNSRALTIDIEIKKRMKCFLPSVKVAGKKAKESGHTVSVLFLWIDVHDIEIFDYAPIRHLTIALIHSINTGNTYVIYSDHDDGVYKRIIKQETLTLGTHCLLDGVSDVEDADALGDAIQPGPNGTFYQYICWRTLKTDNQRAMII